MTPQEILEESSDKHPYDLGLKMVTERAALEAMGVYANDAIELLRSIYVRNKHDMGLDIEISALFEKMGIEL